ncbi:MAG: universal stress protein [Opitutales bacterium]
MKNILICTDGSGYSHEACHYAAWLSRRMDAKIEVLYVTDLRQFEIPAVADFSGSLGIQPFEGMLAQLQEIEDIKSKFIEEQTVKFFEEAGVSERVSFFHETGLLVDVIADYAERADLVLMGKRGENVNFATEHLGSMLERVLRTLKKPCLVTNRTFKACESVVLAYDGGESCRKALDFLADHPLFKDLELHVVVCVEGHKETEATDHLKEVEEKLHKAGYLPKCQVLSGTVESAIAGYVKHAGIDLLIVGAYGHSRIRELLIGSTTTELLRRCHVPVLCFR